MNTRTFIAAGAVALALGLTGCATVPTQNAAAPNDYASTQAEAYASAQAEQDASAIASASAEAEAEVEDVFTDVDVMLQYKAVIKNFQGLLDDLENYANDGDAAGMKSLGNDFVMAAFAGRKLEDVADLGREGNKAWDDAMDDYQVMGGALQTGLFSMAGESMNDATAHIGVATTAMNAANAANS